MIYKSHVLTFLALLLVVIAVQTNASVLVISVTSFVFGMGFMASVIESYAKKDA